jgi:hypothetical protein
MNLPAPNSSSRLAGPATRFGRPPIKDKREQRRRQIVRLVFVIYWLLIFEGVLRKYLFPELGRVLFFVRDPFLLLLYVLALMYGMFPKRSWFLVVGVSFAVLSVPLILIQYFFANIRFDWLLAAYGWRNYFLYLPLAFIVAQYFQAQDMRRLVRWTLCVAIPISALVYFQFLSPITAPINKGLGKADDEVYINAGVAENIPRTFGTFTSSTGQGAFVISSLALLLAAWTMPKSRLFVKRTVLLPATGAVLVCAALSGSRGTVIWAGLVFCAAMVGPWMAPGRTLPLRMAAPLAIVGLGAIFTPLVFPRAADALLARWENAGAAESAIYGTGGVFARVMYDLHSFTVLVGDTPMQGYQLGIGGNAATTLGARESIPASSLEQAGAAETDWGRQILELGPILGILFIGFRIVFVFWLGRESIKATRRSGDLFPVLLFAFVGVLLFNGQITGHGSLNGYAWLFSGFLMAVNHDPPKRSRSVPRLRGRRSMPVASSEASGYPLGEAVAAGRPQ